jgi:hypothetical protein
MKCKGLVTFVLCCLYHGDSSSIVSCYFCDSVDFGYLSGLVVDVGSMVMVVCVDFIQPVAMIRHMTAPLMFVGFSNFTYWRL